MKDLVYLKLSGKWKDAVDSHLRNIAASDWRMVNVGAGLFGNAC